MGILQGIFNIFRLTMAFLSYFAQYLQVFSEYVPTQHNKELAGNLAMSHIVNKYICCPDLILILFVLKYNLIIFY